MKVGFFCVPFELISYLVEMEKSSSQPTKHRGFSVCSLEDKNCSRKIHNTKRRIARENAQHTLDFTFQIHLT